jgi:hypothetical protein
VEVPGAAPVVPAPAAPPLWALDIWIEVAPTAVMIAFRIIILIISMLCCVVSNGTVMAAFLRCRKSDARWAGYGVSVKARW